jgi:hypothetical protein
LPSFPGPEAGARDNHLVLYNINSLTYALEAATPLAVFSITPYLLSLLKLKEIRRSAKSQEPNNKC